MAVFGLKDFLTNYYYQMQFEKMWSDPAVRARFEGYVKNRDFVGKMKDWLEVDELMNVNRAHDPHTYTPKTNIVDAELQDADFEKLFDMFHQAFSRMDADRKSLIYNDPATKFLNTWFGTDKLFSLTVADSSCDTGIEELKNLLENNKGLRQHLVTNKIGGLEKEADVQSFIAKLNTSLPRADRKYNKDGSLREQINTVRDGLLSILRYNTFKETSPEYRAVEAKERVLNQISFKQEHSAAKIRAFKDDYKNILATLFNNGKIRGAFAAYGGDITKYIDEAKDHIPYDKAGEPEFIPPKYDDELDTFEKIKKWNDDTYSNYFKKYLLLKGDLLFYSEYAKQIFKAVDKEKITPKDGLTAVLDKADAIKKRIEVNSKNAAAHFEWFTKTLNAIKDEKPKALAGALQHGGKMRALVSEIIIRAVESGIPGDIEKAKSSMEFLAAMQYGLTTSKTMDALKKENLTIFSDKNLSWNKNGGVAMVSNAIDKTIKFAGMGIGYGATMLLNAAHLSGSTYGKNFQHGKGDKTGARLAMKEQEWAARNNEQKEQANVAHVGSNAYKKQQLRNAQETIRSSINRGAEVANLGHYKSLIDTAERDFSNQLNVVSDWIEIQEYTSTPHPELDVVKRYVQEIVDNGTLPTHTVAWSDPSVGTMMNDLSTKCTAYSTAKATNEPLLETANNKIKQFDEAEETIRMLDAQLADLRNNYNDWDNKHKSNYQELAKHWDTLQDGRTSHLGWMWDWQFGNASKKRMDPQVFKNLVNRRTYSIAA